GGRRDRRSRARPGVAGGGNLQRRGARTGRWRVRCRGNRHGGVPGAAQLATHAHGRRPPVRGRPRRATRERDGALAAVGDRKSTRLNSSHVSISYAVFCLKKKNKKYVC